MRLKLLFPLMLAALVALPTAGAHAAAEVGISENNQQMFSDPNFLALGVDDTRLVVAYDVMEAAANGDDELTSRVRPYLAAAKAAGVTPLISFEHSRGAGELCKTRRSLPQCHLPSPSEYESAIRAFLAAFPDVRVISPFNEANHFTQPTSRNPRAAARFTDIATKVCRELGRKCTIVAVDVLDQADNVRAKRPTYKSTTRWIKTFRKYLKSKRTICGMHNYSDVNRFRSAGTKALMKALKCKSYWLTEAGGLYDFGSFWSKKYRRQYKCKSASACQLKATKYMFSQAKANKKIKRLYVYTWFGAVTPRFDAGLVAGGAARPALAEIQKYVKP
jgi:hypothetical protein